MKPSRARNWASIAGYAGVGVGAVVLLVVADTPVLRFAMVLVLISAALGVVLAVFQLRSMQ